MNPYFVLVLNSERYMDISKTDNYIFLQNVAPRSQIWKWKSRKKDFNSQIILMKKNGMNVEHFHYYIIINYDKSSSACID